MSRSIHVQARELSRALTWTARRENARRWHAPPGCHRADLGGAAPSSSPRAASRRSIRRWPPFPRNGFPTADGAARSHRAWHDGPARRTIRYARQSARGTGHSMRGAKAPRAGLPAEVAGTATGQTWTSILLCDVARVDRARKIGRAENFFKGSALVGILGHRA